ncbi:PAS domain S-box protein [Terriglobus albidus]|uniref:histidine kinase n=1 Tax=Terriglobus albidus TaxID=1592106 RepID=A0A5B9EBE5_9BACT|nr:ATP-binding protein [Terriglobus albidus]QEE29498.1 PAS domain S-box protein [Terriglobus albidus]
MRLKTKLVLAFTALTFAVVLVLCLVFLGELLRQRISQTGDSNDVLVREVTLSTRQALVSGLREHPPADNSDDAFQSAVANAIRGYQPLADEMNAIVRYSPPVQDVTVTGAHGVVLSSTDPTLLDQQFPYRSPFSRISGGGVLEQARAVFGRPQVLDVTLPLDRNGQPFLTIHLGVRSTFLRSSYAPWLKAAVIFALVALAACVLIAALLSSLALHPIERINQQLEQLMLANSSTPLIEGPRDQPDAVVRASQSIAKLGEKIRTTEQIYSALQTNLNQMLETLRDGVILFTADRRAVMVSEAVEGFLGRDRDAILGSTAEDIFHRGTVLGQAVRDCFAMHTNLIEEPVVLEDGREAKVSLQFIHGEQTGSGERLGALLTLHDAHSAKQLEQEIEVSRRLAAIGRLTAGVGHEVKNPINAMVVHLELLRSKLAEATDDSAQKHVDILAQEMQRLDRVVQTLADFSRPIDLRLYDYDLREIVRKVGALTAESFSHQKITLVEELPSTPLMVLVDAELLQQAVLNIVLNGAQAMPKGGTLRIVLDRNDGDARLRIMDEGVGIPTELLPKVFDLYFTTKPKGSGIGLAMTYRMLQLHGGSIDVMSNTNQTAPDHGSTFTILLPLSHGVPGERSRV